MAEPDDDKPLVAYFEWSMPDDADPLDLDAVLAHHPAWGHTVTSRRSLKFDPTIMKAAEYARAYGNLWVSSDAFYIAPKIWDAARSFDPIDRASPVAFAVEVYPDRSGTVIAAAGRDRRARIAVEVVEYRAHMTWAAERVIELVRRHRPVAVAVDPYSPARTVYTRLETQTSVNMPLLAISTADLVQADAEFCDGLLTGAVVHRSNSRLDAALAAATTRQVREQTVISRTGEDETGFPGALVAALLAAFALEHPPATAPAPVLRSAR